MNEAQIDEVTDFFIKSIEAQTRGGNEGHFAAKLTALITTDIMGKINSA